MSILGPGPGLPWRKERAQHAAPPTYAPDLIVWRQTAWVEAPGRDVRGLRQHPLPIDDALVRTRMRRRPTLQLKNCRSLDCPGRTCPSVGATTD